ncbi:MAG: hypothetical protein NTV61_10540 [Candidatus Bathyarchaeota archaeon]|nr:hypothetical protein [Candidatus Bathyarchaeota archaeon]
MVELVKNIQTEIDDKLYRLLKESTEARRMTIKEGIREAVRSWVTEEASIEDDPFFRLKPVDTGVVTDSAKIEEALSRAPR